MALIYKILRAEEWAELEAKGETQGAPIDIQDGYIHFSTAETVEETAQKYFENVDGLKLLAYEDDTFGEALIYEPSRGGLLFPHLYAPLPLSLAIWIKDLPIEGGKHVFPEGL
ncbi:MAG: DUF952 domain-containing protein [Pseudomonadota bacterium]